MCASVGGAGDVAIGVADGVGGWTENGIDPSLFSQALMFYASKSAASSSAVPKPVQQQHPTVCWLKHTSTFSKNLLSSQAAQQLAFSPSTLPTAPSVRPTWATLASSFFAKVLENKAYSTQVHHSRWASTLLFNSPNYRENGPRKVPSPTRPRRRPVGMHIATRRPHHRRTDGLFDNVDAKHEIPQFAKFIKEKHHASYTARHAAASDTPQKNQDSLEEDKEFVQVLATNLVSTQRFAKTPRPTESIREGAARYGIHFPAGKVDDVALVCCLVIES